ncbi:MAG TPA: hypothetical protein VHM24_01140 [Gemmatimonadaceae bacterium]|nr:hypothetical protein [Gemmatimonadaceae bacterium]
MNPAHALLEGLIDYAGLFPPAALDMASAAQAYAEYRGSEDRQLVGRFIVPAGRLDELASATRRLSGRADDRPWGISVIAGPDFAADSERILEFNGTQGGRGNANGPGVDAIELRCEAVEAAVTASSDISRALEVFDDGLDLFLEIPVDPDPAPMIAQLSKTRAFAKIRTGGVSEGAIPSADRVLRFIRACADSGVPFKATAGLHHPVRGRYALTYEPDAPRALLFGFLNIFLAAAFTRTGMRDSELLELLNETDASAFELDEAGARWRDHRVGAEDITAARAHLARSFGSCSFVEPTSELKELWPSTASR